MTLARRCARGASVALAALFVTACLFPDYQVVEGNGGSSGEGGAGVAGGNGGGGTGPRGGTAGATSGGAEPGGAGAGGAGAGGVAGTAGAGASAGGGTAGAAGGGGGAADAGGGGCDGPCPAPEDCGNAVDDDLDGSTDCDDTDCVDASQCAAICTAGVTLPCDTALVGQTTDGLGSTSRLGVPAYSCAAGTYPGPERAYRFSVDTPQEVLVELYALDKASDLFLIDVNAGTQCRADFACAEASLASGTLPDLVAFSAVPNRDYYLVVDGPSAASFAITARCADAGGCRATQPIAAGQTISATNAVGGDNVTQVQSLYSCNIANHLAQEAAFAFTPEATGTYQVDLTNLSGNVSLFVVTGECGTTCVDANASSVSPTNQPEQVTFTGQANETYYIVVDGFITSPVTFDLSVTAL